MPPLPLWMMPLLWRSGRNPGSQDASSPEHLLPSTFPAYYSYGVHSANWVLPYFRSQYQPYLPPHSLPLSTMPRYMSLYCSMLMFNALTPLLPSLFVCCAIAHTTNANIPFLCNHCESWMYKKCSALVKVSLYHQLTLAWLYPK